MNILELSKKTVFAIIGKSWLFNITPPKYDSFHSNIDKSMTINKEVWSTPRKRFKLVSKRVLGNMYAGEEVVITDTSNGFTYKAVVTLHGGPNERNTIISFKRGQIVIMGVPTFQET